MGDKEANNAKEEKVIEQQNYLLPNDLIIQEILTRLPVKSILRFKSVSKQCNSTLSSSDFANAHLIKSPFYHPSAPVSTLFLSSGKSYYFFSYGDGDDDDDKISGSFANNLVKLDVDFGFETEDNFHFTGCCNGLICLTQVPCKCFILWNPATRKFHKYESDGYLKLFEGQFYPFIKSGFGYASSVNDYKYVRILSTLWGNESCIIGVHVFSLSEKRWRKIDFDIELFALIGGAVLINETLYWVGYSLQARHVIVSFNLGIEKFDIFPYPSSDKNNYMIGKMGECLCKFACDKSIDILKPPIIVKSIRLPKCLSLDMFSEMIGYTKTGKFFVMELFSESGDEVQDGRPSYKMSLVDPGTEPMQCRMLLRSSGWFNIARYVPSLISPFPTYSVCDS